MYKPFILLLGVFLSSPAPAAAQTPAPQIILESEHLAPALTMLPTVSPSSLAASFLLYQDPGKFPIHFSRLSFGAYEPDHGLTRLPGMEVVKTLFLTQSSFSLVQFWGGRLQLEAFQDTLRIQSVQLGPLSYGAMSDFPQMRQSYPGGPRSLHLSGLSLSFHFGRDARTGPPAQTWRRLSRIVGTFLQ